MLTCARARAAFTFIVLAVAAAPLGGCGAKGSPLSPRTQTFAELRTVRRAITVTPPGESARPPYPRERLVDGEEVHVDDGGLAWLRRDAGVTLLVRGPAELRLRKDAVELERGRVFVDTPTGATAEVTTPSGPLHLAHVRASIDVGDGGKTSAYVLAGEIRGDGATHASAGERLDLEGKPGHVSAKTAPVLTWDDWTGGLATTDRVAEPAPFGLGTVGARRPGDTGAPRAPLAIQRLDVNVSVVKDLAITEVDETFFNPSSEVVEGVYRFRTPEGAVLSRFGVDREGVVVWGRVKEKQAAAAQYQANVYAGSQEDPALLEWDAPGVYRARLYPIGPGQSRRVVVRYAEWLGRTGEHGERRLYVYPMAAEGAESSLPHIEELTATFDLSRAGAKEIRTGMAGALEGQSVVVRAHDLVPRADLAVELFDDGIAAPQGYTAPHSVDFATLPPSERDEALRRAKGEPDYVLVPVRPADAPTIAPGLDLAIVVDTSAATDPAMLAVARAATTALLAHLGKSDRVGVFTGDDGLRPLLADKPGLTAIDEATRRAIATKLANVARGGATDLGAVLAEAAATLDPARRGAVVYVGDGRPTVGELSLPDLRDRLAKLPRPVRLFGLGVGDGADMALLAGVARGGFAERIGDANGAARAALRLLELAERPAALGTTIDLGPSVERVFPRDVGALVADESVVVIGRVKPGALPTSLVVKGPSGEKRSPLTVSAIDDGGDLARRWATARLAQMLDEGVGRAAMVDLGSRHGIITPYTSLYVPTKNEMTPDELAELEREKARALSATRDAEELARAKRRAKLREADQDEEPVEASAVADNKEGGTGTRAKGEEGSMGNPSRTMTGSRYGVAARQQDLRDAAEFGMIGVLNAGAAPPAAAAPTPLASAKDDVAQAEAQNAIAAANAKLAEATAAAPAPSAAATAAPGDPLAVDAPSEPRAPAMPGSPPPPPKVAGDKNAWGSDIGDSFAAGGLGLSGVGQGGGGRGDGVGLGSIGTIGHGAGTGSGEGFGSGHGRLAAHHPARTVATTPVNGPTTESKPTGGAEEKKTAALDGSYRENAKAPSGSTKSAVIVVLAAGDVPHVAFGCGGAAMVPLDERLQLWRERLARAAGNAEAVANVYRSALDACEAPSFRERARLLSSCLDAMPTVSGKVALWRTMQGDLGAADVLYRGILARVRTPAEVRELHAALGLRTIDPTVLAKYLKDAATPADRVKKLRGLVAVWPDDMTLALRLLDALEDAGDAEGARGLARTLRARPDADAHLRTAVGELYLRLAAHDAAPAQKAADEAEAHRAFGEIVEFAPDDPVARRRLGDLLRAHGFYAESARQYETLAKLTPDDPSVALLEAAAADGLGKLEEAVKWTEKAGAAGAPDAAEGPARTARAFAATYLAWGRLEAEEKGKKDEAETLAARLVRVLAPDRASGAAHEGARVTLTWSHPELHPTLWTNALAAPMPAPEGDVSLGIAQAFVPERDGAWVEIRLEPDDFEHAARLGATATLTVVFDETTKSERIVKRTIHFQKGGPPVQRFELGGREVRP